MDSARFASLVHALEERARRRPRLYRVQVAAVASLGYAYVIGVLVLLLGTLGGLGYLMSHIGGAGILAKLLLPIAWLAWVVLRSLWITVPDLEGIPLPAERFPVLASAIERIRGQVDAPRFRRVLLDGDFNAAVSQKPRFGLLGPSVSDLVVGLPLMHALSPDEFEAVLAHEMGHVSRQHGRFGHWIYRIRTTWGRLAYVVQHSGAATGFLLGRFLGWYAPFFGAYSFVLARMDEYEADATAVRVAGRPAFGNALVRIAVLGRFHSEGYWSRITREVTSGTELPEPYAGFASAVARGVDPSDTTRWLSEALRRPTDHGDTHPSLSDRLAAAGIAAPPAPPPAPGQTAADAFLGAAVGELAGQFDQQWRLHVEPQLEAIRSRREADERHLEEIEAGSRPSADPAWERVEILARLGRDADARAAATALIEQCPDHAYALYYLGQERLSGDDPGGLPLLERAAVLLPTARPAIGSLIFDFHWRHGRREEAEAARARVDAARRTLDAAASERASLARQPVLVAHGLPAERVRAIKAALAKVPELRDAYLAQRVVVQVPELPCYLVGVVSGASWWRFRSAKDQVKLREAVMTAAEWPESTYFVVGGRFSRLIRRMKRIPGSRLTAPGDVVSPAPVPAATIDALRAGMARRGLVRGRVKLGVFTFVAGLLVIGVLGYRSREEVIGTTPIRAFTVARIAQRVRDARGHEVILILYNPYADQAELVGSVKHWVATEGATRVELLSFVTGSRRDAQAFFRYAGDEGLPMLAPFWLEPWAPGSLDSTLGQLGVNVGTSWRAPLVAVIDSNGAVVAQWQGAVNSAAITAVARRGINGSRDLRTTRSRLASFLLTRPPW